MSIRQGNNIIAGSNISVIEKQDPTAQNNYTWYRKYSDGWVEQGGFAYDSNSTGKTVNLPVEMADAHYIINATGNNNSHGSVFHYAIYYSQTTTSFGVAGAYGGSFYATEFYWYVAGKAA